jgi:D-sedoheptulose 7-phosphate isomerase
MTAEEAGFRTYLEQLVDVLGNVPAQATERLIAELERARRSRHQVFLFGNGGSAATASHIANDLAKGISAPGAPKLRVIALTDCIPLITAWANDLAYEGIFAEQLDNLVESGDVVIGISTSGKSLNIIRALELAKARGATTVALTGFDGGTLRGLVDVCLMIPSRRTEQIEDAHLAVAHACIVALRASAHAAGTAEAGSPSRPSGPGASRPGSQAKP